VAGIEGAHIAPPHGLHQLGDALHIFGCRQKLKLVVQQHMGVQGDTVGARSVGQKIKQEQAVRRVNEDRLLVVPDLQNMVRMVGKC
jgi:hypothetical protein